MVAVGCTRIDGVRSVFGGEAVDPACNGWYADGGGLCPIILKKAVLVSYVRYSVDALLVSYVRYSVLLPLRVILCPLLPPTSYLRLSVPFGFPTLLHSAR